MSTLPNLPAVLDAVRILSPVAGSPDHGEEHWRRVAANGLDLARLVGADSLVVVLFAIFHDCMRFDEYRDSDHGKRGGFLACCLNNELLGLSDDRLDLLYSACAGHPDGGTSKDPTIGACWDADRLDLYRLEQGASAAAMSTAPARTTAVHERAMALVTSAPDWASIFLSVDPVAQGARELERVARGAREVEPRRPEPVPVEPRRPEPVPVEPRRPEPVPVEARRPEPAIFDPRRPEPVPVEPRRPQHALVEPNRNKPAPLQPEARRPEPAVAAKHRGPTVPGEGRHYWTATLINAPPASNDDAPPASTDDASPVGTGDGNKRVP